MKLKNSIIDQVIFFIQNLHINNTNIRNILEKKLELNFKLQKHLYYARKELHKIIQKKIKRHLN